MERIDFKTRKKLKYRLRDQIRLEIHKKTLSNLYYELHLKIQNPISDRIILANDRLYRRCALIFYNKKTK